MKYTYYGHSCFLVETGGKKFLFDPFISGNELTKGIVDAGAVEADYIFVSHGHGRIRHQLPDPDRRRRW